MARKTGYTNHIHLLHSICWLRMWRRLARRAESLQGRDAMRWNISTRLKDLYIPAMDLKGYTKPHILLWGESLTYCSHMRWVLKLCLNVSVRQRAPVHAWWDQKISAKKDTQQTSWNFCSCYIYSFSNKVACLKSCFLNFVGIQVWITLTCDCIIF